MEKGEEEGGGVLQLLQEQPEKAQETPKRRKRRRRGQSTKDLCDHLVARECQHEFNFIVQVHQDLCVRTLMLLGGSSPLLKGGAPLPLAESLADLDSI